MLIFTNCRKYNPPEHDVVGMSRKLEEVFLDKMAKVRSDVIIPVPGTIFSSKPMLTTGSKYCCLRFKVHTGTR
jgi:hypothetical protein